MEVNVDYVNEFRLISSKQMFKFDEISSDELALWLDCLEYNEFDVNDPREIFVPNDGEDYALFNKEIGTSSLHVCKWKWTCNGKEHDLIEMSSYTEDVERGVIAIDGIPILNNKDAHFEFRDNEREKYPEFASRLPLFCELLDILFGGEEDEKSEEKGMEVEEGVGLEGNRLSDNERVKEVKAIVDAAHKLYESKFEAVRVEMCSQRDLYKNEFSFMYHKVDGTSLDLDYLASEKSIATRIGYKAKLDFARSTANHINYYFVKWIYQADRQIHGITDSQRESINQGDRQIDGTQILQGSAYQEKEYVLVTVSDRDSLETYLLNKDNKIDYMIFKEDYLVKEDGQNPDLCLALQQRIQAFTSVRDDPSNFPAWIN